jgi:hypothetical protein
MMSKDKLSVSEKLIGNKQTAKLLNSTVEHKYRKRGKQWRRRELNQTDQSDGHGHRLLKSF